jgi:hypothetical protein
MSGFEICSLFEKIRIRIIKTREKTQNLESVLKLSVWGEIKKKRQDDTEKEKVSPNSIPHPGNRPRLWRKIVRMSQHLY